MGPWPSTFCTPALTRQPYELTRFVVRADMTGLLCDVPVE
jgi:hypothetical protein